MRASCLRSLVVVLAIRGAACAAEERIEVGPLKLDITISRTAALFHVVDQLSEWSYYSHRQYGRAFAPLSDIDRVMLEKHKAVRAKHPWGRGLEQTFYSPLPLDDALRAGTRERRLSRDEAAIEREVFLHFAPRIDALLDGQTGSLAAFRERMRRELSSHAQVLAQFARFTGNIPDVVPVYLLPNPDAHNTGGGYNGGRLTIEVPTVADAMPTALHEIFHVFLQARKSDIGSAVAGVPGLNAETMNEGLAYAFSPGLVHSGPADEDPLAKRVGRDRDAGKTLSDAYTRFNRFGLMLRPLLRSALADDAQTLGRFLPRAVDVWRALQEIETARGPTPTPVAAPVAPDELRTVTIVGLYRHDAAELPAWVKELNAQNPKPTELFIACKEWVSGGYRQMSTFSSRASRDFLLVAPGQPDVRARLNRYRVSRGDGSFQAYGLELVAEDRDKVAAGVSYSVKPINTSETYRWQVSENLIPIELKE